MADVVILGSPASVGHVRPLMPLARRLVERGLTVIWAISGDASEPASAWQQPLTELGVHVVDVDQVARFERVVTNASFSLGGLRRRVLARANDVAAAATEAIRRVVGERRIVAGVLDFFSLWSFMAMKRLGVPRIRILVSAFPGLELDWNTDFVDDEVYQRELAMLRAAGLEAGLMSGIVPVDPTVQIFAATSRHLCSVAPPAIHLLGVPREALPASAREVPPEHHALVQRLRTARAAGSRIVLLSMGSIVIKFGATIDPAFPAFVRRLYTTIAAAALHAGALVVASTNESSPDAVGLDEGTLGSAARERVITLPFVPQPLLFAHGLVDTTLMHGGANTFHETALAGIPSLVCPVLGDQASVAQAVVATGVGVAIESPTMPNVPNTRSLHHVAAEIVPVLLAPDSPWKREATRLAALLAKEDGITAQLAFVLGGAGDPDRCTLGDPA